MSHITHSTSHTFKMALINTGALELPNCTTWSWQHLCSQALFIIHSVPFKTKTIQVFGTEDWIDSDSRKSRQVNVLLGLWFISTHPITGSVNGCCGRGLGVQSLRAGELACREAGAAGWESGWAVRQGARAALLAGVAWDWGERSSSRGSRFQWAGRGGWAWSLPRRQIRSAWSVQARNYLSCGSLGRWSFWLQSIESNERHWEHRRACTFQLWDFKLRAWKASNSWSLRKQIQARFMPR